MSCESEYILINCPECAAFCCEVSCKENAIAFFHGNIMVEGQKCVSCSDRGGGNLPLCIERCDKSEAKNRIEEISSAKKRENAVSALYYKA